MIVQKFGLDDRQFDYVGRIPAVIEGFERCGLEPVLWPEFGAAQAVHKK
jgi:hypothetical protein